MAKEQFSIRLEPEVMQKIRISSDKSINAYINKALRQLMMIRNYSTEEMVHYFEPEEWKFLVEVLKDRKILNEDRCRSFALCTIIKEYMLYNNKQDCDIDIIKLNEKIEPLTAAQIDAIYSRIEDYYNISSDIRSENGFLDQWADF